MIIVTGCAGFIGHALCVRLLKAGNMVVGIDNMNAYYDISLKQARLANLTANKNFFFHFADVSRNEELLLVFRGFTADMVVHLAAQAGVRHSLDKPQDYIDSNITGFLNVLNACRDNNVKRLIYASSSSVYGLHHNAQSAITDATDTPANLYAVSKKCNELMAHAYHHLYGLQSVGLRFFTVYGPWGRPDMALFKFTRAMLAGESIDVYNGGAHVRSFTYIDDIVDGIIASMQIDGLAVHNIGGEHPVRLVELIEILERIIGRTARINMMPMQKGDVHGSIAAPSALPGYAPRVGIEEGVRRFVEWYRGYYGV